MSEIANLPKSERRRIVIVGGGFAGRRLAEKSLKNDFQVVLIDRNNYYQFQPLLYQVAIAGLEPSAVSFPLRRMFQGKKNDFHFRMAEIVRVNASESTLETTIGSIHFDYLVLATGVTTNFFGNANIEKKALTMKSVSDAILIRNTILENLEKAINCRTDEERLPYLNIAIVGGGPAGVELAGALAEMRKYILPKDYPDYDFHQMKIFLFEAMDRILGNMRDKSSVTATRYLEKLSVNIRTNTRVRDYNGDQIFLESNEIIPSKTLIWTAGVTAVRIEGLEASVFGHANRILTDEFNRVKNTSNIFAIGDLSLMATDRYPKGHPQVAPAALQQASLLARNLLRLSQGESPKPYRYYDKGTLTSIGRNLAVADLKRISLKGFIAWIVWSLVHLFSIVGGKNKVLIFIDWASNYLIFDPSLRLLIKTKNNL
jgi:NADH:ubiquinone reductase (H+-translocating)